MDIKDKVDLESLDIKKDKINKLKGVFPEAVSEGKVDFEKLRLTLGDKVETGKERYGMNWPGKANCFKIIQTPSKATLKPAKDESIDFDTTENLFIEGDNLEVLKLLQSSYYGKVKMIYIDPPYNTGNDFVYPDNYAESLETYLRYTGQKGKEGLKLSTNTETEGRYHSKWMNMMYVRLFLAKNLLKEDGVALISIDDHEVDNLKKICNEIFGDENFVEQIIWKKRSTPPNDKTIGANHDYILIFAKDISKLSLNLRPRTDDQIARYKNPDNHIKGNWTSGDLMANVKGGRYVSSLYFPIINPNTGEEHFPGNNGNWRFSKITIEKLLSNNEIYFGEDGKGRPKLKRFLNAVKKGTTWPTIWDFAPLNTQGSDEMTRLLGSMTIFENPKPSGLIFELLNLGSDNDSIILDFFAGSATTAHAVLELNKDGGNRKFIMVQIPEPTDENSEAFKVGYKDVAQIGKERIRKVIKTIKDKKDGKLDLDDKKQDLGFRVFKLDESNFKVWEGEKPEDLVEQLELYKNNVRDESKPEDILYELILKSGFAISCKVEELDIQGKKVYSIEDGQLMICLEKGLTKELMKEIAEKEPARVICLDEGFEGNDQLLTNTVEVLKTKGVEFRTV